MFAQSIIVAALAAFAAAGPVARGGDSKCNTGPVQCCNSVQDSKSAGIAGLVGLVTALVGPVTGQVGLTCSPLTAIGVSGNSCSQQPVCCENNNFNGIIAIGCTPININL
ncbi:hypothetical protein HGRIS_014158 [Hohenbuehelia grisea]|uniref:Hydrophobin n=1 Tax=Hohenbuehelia grisea TaxID=104357 RepID=A0ABR3JUH9_9AGAR